MYVLSELRPCNGINSTIQADIYGDALPAMIISKHNHLEFYIVGETVEDRNLRLVDSLYVEDAIVAINKFQHPNLEGESLIILTELFNLSILHYDRAQGQFDILHRIEFDSGNHQLSSDIRPKIIVDLETNSRFFLVYCFEGFLQYFSVNPNWQLNTTNKRKLTNIELLDHITFPIGAIVVQDIQILHSTQNDTSDCDIAVLYRDYNYNYLAKLCKLDFIAKTLELSKQYEEFSEPPTVLVSLHTGGFLVITDNYLFYFPVKDMTVSISDTNEDKTITVNKQIVTKRLASLKPHNMSAFQCHIVIDTNRIILINNRGETFLLYIDIFSATRSSAVVNNISMIMLGFTTVPLSIHHLNENFFYVASRLSQSLTFEILPQQPFINILEFYETSTPILDIQPIRDSIDGLWFLSCQGGYESGEFRRISNSDKLFDFKLQFQTRIVAKQLKIMDNELYIINPESKQCQLVTIDEKYKYKFKSHSNDALFKTKDLQINSNSVTFKGHLIYKGPVLIYKVTDDGYSIIMNTKEIQVFINDTLAQVINVNDEVSDFDMLKVFNSYILVVALWNGSFLVYDGSGKISSETKLTDTAITSCCIIPVSSTTLWLLFVTSNNQLFEIYYNYETNKQDPNRLKVTNFSGIPLKFKKHTEHEYFLFNNKSIYILTSGIQNQLFPIMEFSESINDICVYNNHLVASLNDNDIHVYSIKAKSEIIYSNDFNMKSINIDSYSIILSSRNALFDNINNYGRNCFLKLIDLRTMQCVHQLNYSDQMPVEMVDILPFHRTIFDIDNEDGESKVNNDVFDSDFLLPPNSFLGLCNCNQNDILRLYQIDNNQIVELNKIKIQGLKDASQLSNKSIKLVDAKALIFLITGTLNFFVQAKTIDEWIVIPDSILKSSIYSISSGITSDHLILADVMKGLTAYKFQVENATLRLNKDSQINYIDTDFITSFVTVGDTIILTDSLGNIIGLEFDGNMKNETILFNIGDAINVIKPIPASQAKLDFTLQVDKSHIEPLTTPLAVLGTVNGGIYVISLLNDVDQDIETALVDCNRKLVNYKHTMTDIQINKNDKYASWLEKRNQKCLQQDETGRHLTKQTKGILDLTLIQAWLKSDDVNNEQLKACYEHKSLLERVVYGIL